MFRKLLISLVAVGLVTIFIAEAANALVSRRRNTVENFHICSEFLPGTILPGSIDDRDPCFGGTLVSDALFGADELKNAICIMTGQVICEDPEFDEICTASNTDAVLDAAEDSFKNNANFSGLEFVVNLTSLDELAGEELCLGDEEFVRYWPVTFVAYSVYSGDFTNIPLIRPGMPKPSTYELIEYCKSVPDTDEYYCEKVWDSIDEFDGIPKPPLPCCNETNTLIVTLSGNGTIKADNVPMECADGSCSEDYIGGERPDYNGCPEVTLTATAETGWEFAGWSGGGCSGIGTCEVTADTSGVTAIFSPKLNVATVGNGTVTSTDGKINCPGDCNETYPLDESVSLLASPDPGWAFAGWSGDGCSGAEPSCTFIMDQAREVTATFEQAPTLTVIIVNGDANDRVRIFSPRDLDYTHPVGTDICRTADTPCTIEFLEFGAEVTLKKQGDSINWGGACSGVDNSVDTCDVTVTEGADNIVYVNFN